MENSSTPQAHTQGDWTVAPCNGAQRLIFADGRLLAIVGDFPDAEPGEIEANARLMAAAPKLLRYLLLVLDEYATHAEEEYVESTAVSLALDAMEQARGEAA